MSRPASYADKLTDMPGYQSEFHRQWQHLRNQHVRALAWMLTAPVLLEVGAQIWQGKVATVPVKDTRALSAWLSALDSNPTALLDLLQQQASRRLGLYAETLFEFYLKSHDLLHAHGLQVHHKGANTIGEFDFLMQTERGLEHWELATKFYLYHPGARADDALLTADLYDYLGPNLADSLGAKLNKIMGQQLSLSAHPLAQAILPGKIRRAQALVLGWLFYRDSTLSVQVAGTEEQCAGLNRFHCRGSIWTASEIAALDFKQALVLDRLVWLAPAQTDMGETLSKANIEEILEKHLENSASPVMLALMQENQAYMQEYQRGMVVPDDWFARANEMKLKRARQADALR